MITNKKILPKKEKKVEKKVEPKTEEKAIEETFADAVLPKKENNVIEVSNEPVYSVQIYSSPSKEDADMWLQKLKDKRVSEAFISVQLIRGKEWYRVRFGRFPTREEAKVAALNYGFTQTWIDRIK